MIESNNAFIKFEEIRNKQFIKFNVDIADTFFRPEMAKLYFLLVIPWLNMFSGNLCFNFSQVPGLKIESLAPISRIIYTCRFWRSLGCNPNILNLRRPKILIENSVKSN